MARRNWPHPVLDSEGEDYPNCAFQMAVEVKQTAQEIECRGRIELGSDYLLSVVGQGKAAFALQVQCARTAYRSAFIFNAPEVALQISEGLLRDSFYLRPYVVATTPLTLASDEFSDLFAGMSFQVEPGYVLAIGAQTEYFAEKLVDDLRDIQAIFQVVKNSDASSRVVEYDFDDQRITILLPRADFELYRLFRRRRPYRELLLCALVLPALEAAIRQIVEEPDEVATRWRRVLGRRLGEIGQSVIDPERALAVAQLLLDYPFERSCAAIREAEESREA